jgi:hypothetical protein
MSMKEPNGVHVCTYGPASPELETGACSRCGTGIVYKPSWRDVQPKVCIACVLQELEDNNDEGEDDYDD